MDKNKNCSACNIKLDINNYKKDRTICRDCYNKKKRKININTLPPNKIIENVNKQSKFENNNRTLLVRPSFSGKTYLMIKNLSRLSDRDIYIITKSPQNSIPILKSKLKKQAMKLNL